MNILFHSNQLGFRGTEVALFDYAFYTRKYLNVNPIIVSNKNANMDSYDKFKKEFKVILYDNPNQIDGIVEKYSADYMYFIKAGGNDGILSNNTKSLIHTVFQQYDPHGYVYAYVSEWLSLKMTNKQSPFVPHMISILDYDHNENLRDYLGISDNTFVYGYYGGNDSFNISYVKEFIHNIESKHNIKFLFMNVDRFTDNKNAIFLEGTHNIRTKIAFINTCNACIHARSGGESFGLTIGEFSIKNKPIVTVQTQPNWDNNHMYILGNNAIIYNHTNINDVLLDLPVNLDKSKNWNFYNDFLPEKVTQIFNNVFLG